MALPTKIEVKKRKQAQWWTGQIVEGRTVRIRVDQDLCMASQSCISLAPKVFRIDWSKKKSNFEGAPIEVKDKKQQIMRLFSWLLSRAPGGDSV